MDIVVQKYGGTSVGSIERINAVARRIAACRARGLNIVVVVSAMAGETDRLIGLCRAANDGDDDNHALARDSVISVGEQITAGLLALALEKIGVRAKPLTGGQTGIRTDDAHGKARIIDIHTQTMREALNAGVTPIIPGFQGRSAAGAVATLGRGGSDTTAVALAAALAAQECQIFTDVDGVYTTDPRVCAKARRLPTVHFEEMLEMASLGSKVLQLRAVEFAGKYRVPLRVLSSMNDNNACNGGTLVTYQENGMENPIVTGVAFNRAEAKITVVGVPDKPGIAYRLLSIVAAANINVDMIVQNIGESGRTDFSFTVHRDDYAAAVWQTNIAAAKVSAREVIGDAAIGKVSVVGVGMKSHAGVACKMFETLAANDVNIKMISTSEIKISVVISEAQLDAAVNALHDAFALEKSATEEK